MFRLLSLLLCAGCGAGAVHSERTREAIVGGAPSLSDSSVFMLDIRGDNGATTRCSATLIAPRTLLTAAHCADPAMLGATTLTLIASNAPTAEAIDGGTTVRVTQTRLHPMWNAAAGLGSDLALGLLETRQAATPSAWNRTSLTGLGGEPVRAVGYGADGPDAGTGTRRTVDLTIRQLTPELISLGNFVDKGICHGDSGGPTFHTFGDGVERLIGVHSFTRADDCLDGADTRIDAKANFVLQWLSEFEESCAANFVCAVGACVPVDPDCVALGQPCNASWDCRGRQCVSDAQHPENYCSKTCASDADCTGGLRCDTLRAVCQQPQLPTARPTEPCLPGATFCLSGAVCNGPTPELARCSQPCTRTLDCLAPQTCRTGFLGTNACFDPPPITFPVARLELPAATGCSAGVGLWPLLALAWLWRRRRVLAWRSTAALVPTHHRPTRRRSVSLDA